MRCGYKWNCFLTFLLESFFEELLLPCILSFLLLFCPRVVTGNPPLFCYMIVILCDLMPISIGVKRPLQSDPQRLYSLRPIFFIDFSLCSQNIRTYSDFLSAISLWITIVLVSQDSFLESHVGVTKF